MHTHDLDIHIDQLAKIEGQAELDIRIRGGKVEDVQLRVMQNKRFYDTAVKGKDYRSVPQLVSRICGTCSIAHLTGCIEAVEKTLGVVPSAQTLTLRKLTMHSLMIRDHALHLYFFVMPDLYGYDSMLDMVEDKKELVHEALHVKEAGNNLSKLVAGRAIHAPFEQVGGFANDLDVTRIPAVIEELEGIRPSVLKLIDIFRECAWVCERDICHVALRSADYSYLEGKLQSSCNQTIEEKDFWNHLHNVVIPYSHADSYAFEGREYMVGALARMNVNREALSSRTKRDAAEAMAMFPSKNIFHNNLAQAIEILHSIDHSIELLKALTYKKEAPIVPTNVSGEGVGLVEAPRGVLYYWLAINEGKVRYAHLVIPTAQNLISMRESIRIAVPKLLERGAEKKDIEKEAEKIIRAYDPCMSCASHFLKVRWV